MSARPLGEDGRREDRQRRVLRPAHEDLARERVAAVHDEGVHVTVPHTRYAAEPHGRLPAAQPGVVTTYFTTCNLHIDQQCRASFADSVTVGVFFAEERAPSSAVVNRPDIPVRPIQPVTCVGRIGGASGLQTLHPPPGTGSPLHSAEPVCSIPVRRETCTVRSADTRAVRRRRSHVIGAE